MSEQNTLKDKRAVTIRFDRNVDIEQLFAALHPTFEIRINEINCYDLTYKSTAQLRNVGDEIIPYKSIRSARPKNLNAQEIHILSLLAKGYSYEQIAEVMKMSLNGLRYYIKKIYRILNVKNGREAVNLYFQEIAV
ncbi:helix-turn-helix transcriptional regulator [Arundinibacter roseus]|uniref:LuxR family transcriptional regulator n=1 Tax=Arundinibacter roseus TaxID=2070510 RepID=A0A4R4K212_9BACT|nr:helix-turn-helix transcriptional regulator [Arundinibacter roseus]TDB61354.1 LuxR family transcriptional regulator [Arundinibacter roseus]